MNYKKIILIILIYNVNIIYSGQSLSTQLPVKTKQKLSKKIKQLDLSKQQELNLEIQKVLPKIAEKYNEIQNKFQEIKSLQEIVEYEVIIKKTQLNKAIQQQKSTQKLDKIKEEQNAKQKELEQLLIEEKKLYTQKKEQIQLYADIFCVKNLVQKINKPYFIDDL